LTDSPYTISSVVEYDQLDENASVRKQFAAAAETYEREIEAGLTVSANDEQDNAKLHPHRRTKNQATRRHFRDAWPQTILRNITRHTPGVLTTVELAHLMQSIIDLRNVEIARANKATLALFAGQFCGWTEQLVDAQVCDKPPNPFNHHSSLAFLQGTPFASIRPTVPVGRPIELTPEGQDEQVYLAAVERHRAVFEPISPSYLIALHPVLAWAVQQVCPPRSASWKLMSKREYTQAFSDLTLGLRRYCVNAANITPGRLAASFHGYAGSLGFDASDCYAICGRAMKHQEMPINYTYVSIAETCQRHWGFVNQLISEIAGQHDALGRLLGWPTIPWLVPAGDMPADIIAELGDCAGSWSIPRISWVRSLFAFVEEQARRQDLPENELWNWRVRRIAFETIPIMLMRDFEFNAMELPSGYSYRGDNFAHAAKQKYWEERETCVVKHIPDFFRERWWNGIEQCTSGYQGGPIWCLRDGNGHRLPFDLQVELDRTLDAMGIADARMRAYGLRHLGRTEHRRAGMPESLLNYKMNHYGEGYEKFNPGRDVSYRHYCRIDNEIARKVAAALNIGVEE
jgi:hypothetical protein